MSMEARIWTVALIVGSTCSLGATHRTPNFVVDAPNPAVARQVATAAEAYRRDLAVEWLGRELPQWSAPCAVTVRVGQLGAGGATTFSFDRGEVYGWKMRIQGSLERILDSVLPHEINHTIFACHFRRPLPRWADEGAATLIEHESEQHRQRLLLQQVLQTSRKIPLRTLLSLKEYPQRMQQVLTLYAEGYSLADFLVQDGGKTRFLHFLQDAHKESWDRAVQKHYGDRGVENLEVRWSRWILAGSPSLTLPAGQAYARISRPREFPATEERVVRAQNPEEQVASSTGSPSSARDVSQTTAMISASRQWRSRRSQVQNAMVPKNERPHHRRFAENEGWVPFGTTRNQREFSEKLVRGQFFPARRQNRQPVDSRRQQNLWTARYGNDSRSPSTP